MDGLGRKALLLLRRRRLCACFARSQGVVKVSRCGHVTYTHTYIHDPQQFIKYAEVVQKNDNPKHLIQVLSLYPQDDPSRQSDKKNAPAALRRLKVMTGWGAGCPLLRTRSVYFLDFVCARYVFSLAKRFRVSGSYLPGLFVSELTRTLGHFHYHHLCPTRLLPAGWCTDNSVSLSLIRTVSDF